MIVSERVHLEPLAVGHAEQMVDVLADSSLYEFTGGHPPTLEQLQRRYRAQVAGHSPNNSQWWLNWIVVLVASRRPMGYVQATVEYCRDVLTADSAWVISPRYQGRGFASEAVTAMMWWLERAGVTEFFADIHPNHAASEAIAHRQGLRPTDMIIDGEVRWQSSRPGSSGKPA